MHATTVKNKITQRDNYKEIMSVIVVVLLLTLTLIAIFSAIDQLGISEMGRIARDLTHFIINSLHAAKIDRQEKSKSSEKL
ncbi:two-component system connector SafA [Escherichia coli]|nr:two-component system connector SafA [Escherichia coli]MBE1079342.1 two-component system connector SafA [Escherichia coli]